jgi:hypothetical protein
MTFEYLDIMAKNSAPKPPRVLAAPSERAFRPLTKPLDQSCVALLSSAALRLASQEPFAPREDLSYRKVPSDPDSGPIIIDHHSGIGTVPRQDPEIVFPRAALAALAKDRVVRALSPFYFSFMGGVRRHEEIEHELAPALAAELASAGVDLALLVPY